jgi:hypothetical protein
MVSSYSRPWLDWSHEQQQMTIVPWYGHVWAASTQHNPLFWFVITQLRLVLAGNACYTCPSNIGRSRSLITLSFLLGNFALTGKFVCITINSLS